jgi:aldehyde:ferredoxin oxidoreductase
VRRAAEIIGKGAHRYAAHVKGLELTAYHPAAMLGSALGYAVSSRGGDYNNVYASLEHRWPAEKGADAFGSRRIGGQAKTVGQRVGWCAGPCW